MRKVVLALLLFLFLVPISSAFAEEKNLLQVAELIEGKRLSDMVDKSTNILESDKQNGSILNVPEDQKIDRKLDSKETDLKKRIMEFKENLLNNKQKTSQNVNSTSYSIGVIDINDTVIDILEGPYTAKGYLFYNPTPQKLTVHLINPVPYGLYLAKIDENTLEFTDIVYSLYDDGRDQQLSQIADEGIYYIEVASFEEYDPNNPFGFYIVQSPNYDSNEPDDNAWQSNLHTDVISIQGTIDNSIDQDWILYNVTQRKALDLRLDNNSSSKYYVTIYNGSLQELATFSQNQTYYLEFAPGVFFIKIESLGGYDPQSYYKFTIKEPQIPYRVQVTKIGSMSDIEGYTNYGYGYMWRVQYFMDVQGVLKDKNGKPIANETIQVITRSGVNNTYDDTMVTTNEKGEFSAPLSLEHAVGRYSYYNGWSTHYFDIIPLWFYSPRTGELLISNESDVYHFAYQMR